MLVDERFQSSMESEEQCHWLPVQVLNAVHNTSTLPDAVQVDVMKVSLVMHVHQLHGCFTDEPRLTAIYTTHRYTHVCSCQTH